MSARGGRIVSLSPGITDTHMGNAELEENKAAVETLIANTPVGARQGRPQEIAAVAAFVCSEAASFMTGVDLLVDGGSTHAFCMHPRAPSARSASLGSWLHFPRSGSYR